MINTEQVHETKIEGGFLWIKYNPEGQWLQVEPDELLAQQEELKRELAYCQSRIQELKDEVKYNEAIIEERNNEINYLQLRIDDLRDEIERLEDDP